MKKIYKYIGMFAFAGILFTSCDSDDDGTGDSIINYSPTTVTLTSDMNNLIIDESSLDPDAPMEITVMASIPEPLPIDLHIPLVTQTGTTATEGVDFHLGEIVIPSSTTSGSATVIIERTGDVEGDEALVIGAGDVANANVNPFSLNVNITDDYINTSLDLTVAWEGEITIEEDDSITTVMLCGIDFDFKLFDAVTFTDYGYLFASGDCPEEGTFGIFDGSFILVAELYANPFSGFGDTTDVPITVNWNHEYFNNSGSITVPGNYNLSTSDATYPQAPLVIINVSDGGETWEVLPY